MIEIKAYRKKLIFLSKYGEELDPEVKDDSLGIVANLMRDGQQELKEVLFYTACGETKEEAEKALQNYINYIDFAGEISRMEVTEKPTESATQ